MCMWFPHDYYCNNLLLGNLLQNDMPASLGEGMAKFRYINAAPCGAEISLRGAGEIVYPFERVDIKSVSRHRSMC